jgi:hypothetical protein
MVRVDELQAEIAQLREALVESRLAAARAEERVEAARAVAIADVATAKTEVDAAKRVAEAEVAAKDMLVQELRGLLEQVRGELAEARRPWWRRLIGS